MCVYTTTQQQQQHIYWGRVVMQTLMPSVDSEQLNFVWYTKKLRRGPDGGGGRGGSWLSCAHAASEHCCALQRSALINFGACLARDRCRCTVNSVPSCTRVPRYIWVSEKRHRDWSMGDEIEWPLWKNPEMTTTTAEKGDGKWESERELFLRKEWTQEKLSWPFPSLSLSSFLS